MGLALAPSTAYSDAARFIPRIYSYSGELEINARHEFDKEKTLTGKTRSSDLTLIEKLNLSVLGYVYHPRFMTLRLKLSGGLRHNWYDTKETHSDRTSSAYGYDFMVRILPEHPYSLDLFTMRTSPFVGGRIVKGTRKDIFSKGAIFNYKKGRLFFNARYITNSTEMRRASSDSKTYGISGTYYLGPSSTTAGYSKTESKSTGGIKGFNESYHLTNKLGSSPVSFISGVSLSKSSQENPSYPRLENETFAWTEALNVSLPGNFEWKANYSRLEHKRKEDGESEISTENNVRLTVSHRLYQSLSTNYTKDFRFSKSDAGGKIETISDLLSMSYTKKIPIGTLKTGFSYQTSLSERKGGPDITITETHNFDVVEANGGILFLRQRPILDEASIRIRISAINLDTGASGRFELRLDEHYMILDYETAEILIFDLPPEIDYIEWYPENYHVSYKVPGDVELRTKTLSYNVRLELFKNRISPYYIYKRTTQDVLSGTWTRKQDDSPSHTLGVDIMSRDLPVTVSGYVQRVYSDINPSLKYSAKLEYRKSLDPTTRLTAKAEYARTNYYERTATQSYSSTVYSISAKLQRSIPRKKLNMSLRTAFSHLEGKRRANNYSLAGNLTWKVGKLDVGMSAALNYSDRKDSSRLASSLHLNVKRKLF